MRALRRHIRALSRPFALCSTSSVSKLRAGVVVASLALAHAAAAVVWLHSVRFDDAFISFRYGQNLALGRGLVFNVGDHVWGATTVLWVVIAAAVHRLVGHEHTPSVMAGVGCVAWSVQGVLVWVFARRFSGRLAAWLAAAAIALGMAESFTWVAMETNLVFDLAFGALLAALVERYYLAGVLAVLAVLGRPDLVVAAAIVAVLAVHRLRSGVWRPLALAAALAIPAAILLARADALVPRSAASKYATTSFGAYLLHEFAIVPAEVLSAMTATTAPRGMLVAGLFVWPLVAYGAIALVKIDRRLAALPAWLLLHLVGYLVWRPLASQVWHLYPAIVVAIVLLVVGTLTLREKLARLFVVRWVAFPALFSVLGLLAALRTAAFAKFEQHSLFWFEPRNNAYADAARIIHAESDAGDVVAGGEVGTLAYYSDERVEDWNGLVNDWHPLVAALAAGRPGRVRWLVGWAPGDVAYFRATVAGHVPRIYPFGMQRKVVWLFDLKHRGPPE